MEVSKWAVAIPHVKTLFKEIPISGVKQVLLPDTEGAFCSFSGYKPDLRANIPPSRAISFPLSVGPTEVIIADSSEAFCFARTMWDQLLAQNEAARISAEHLLKLS